VITEEGYAVAHALCTPEASTISMALSNRHCLRSPDRLAGDSQGRSDSLMEYCMRHKSEILSGIAGALYRIVALAIIRIIAPGLFSNPEGSPL
jgi:hypothetical protein